MYPVYNSNINYNSISLHNYQLQSINKLNPFQIIFNSNSDL